MAQHPQSDIAGVYFARRLLIQGWTKSAIQHRLRTGNWLRIVKGVYFDPNTALPDSLARAALVLGGPGAVLSHEYAAALHRFDSTAGWAQDIVVSKRRGCALSPIVVGSQTIRFVRRVNEPESTTMKRLLVTSRSQTMIDVSAKLSPVELERVAESFLRGDDPKRPHDWRKAEFVHVKLLIDAHPRVPGASRLRQFLHARGPVVPTGSIAETAALQAVRPIPEIGPILRQPEVRTKDEDGDRSAFIDLLAAELLVILEIDGSHHLTKEQHASDLRRDRKMRRAFTVLRFSAHEALYQPEVLVKTVESEIRRLRDEQKRGLRRHRDWELTRRDLHWQITRKQ